MSDYGDWQDPGGGYGDSQQPGTLYADAGTATPPKPTTPSTGSASPATPSVGTTTSIINVGVNPASKLGGPAFVDLINKSPGTVPEFKGNITLNRRTTPNTLSVPDYSQNKSVSGKEWLVDLGTAGNDWEITTGLLVLVLDGQTGFRYEEDIDTKGGEERGYPVSKDPDESLLRPEVDLRNIRQGLLLGWTIPNQTQLSKNPSPPKIPPPQIARLKSGRGLIIISQRIAVQKKGTRLTLPGKKKEEFKTIPVPQSMVAMTFFHELAAHASFFEQGRSAAHSDPPDPVNNPVDRNAAQAEASYRAVLGKDLEAVQKAIEADIAALQKAVP
jgi:hypothetical protein